MADVTSTTSLAALRSIYMDNLSYDSGSGDSTKAQRFIEACRAILSLPERVESVGRNVVQFNHSEVRRQLENAEGWIRRYQSINAGRGRITHVTFDGFRN